MPSGRGCGRRSSRGRYRSPLKRKEQKRLLARLTAVEGLEHFLHKAYLGQKRFSIEGLDAMVPMLDLVLELAAEGRTKRAVIGMAHRGRLNVLTHIVGLPVKSVLAEFEAGKGAEAPTEGREIDDVKYHLGAGGHARDTPGHRRRHAHAEPVPPRGGQPGGRGPRPGGAGGSPRAAGHPRHQADGPHPHPWRRRLCRPGSGGRDVQPVPPGGLRQRRHGPPDREQPDRVHHRGGEARSTTWASDLAKGFDVPIIHVNADDPEACLDAVRLAMAYRAEFDGDVVIDLVGYRRYGHNEADEPSYTQPGMYDRIARQPSARAQYAERLVAAEVVSEKQAAEMADEVRRELVAAQAAVRKAHAEPPLDRGAEALTSESPDEPATGVGMDVLLALNEQVHAVPRGVHGPSQARPPDRPAPGGAGIG